MEVIFKLKVEEKIKKNKLKVDMWKRRKRKSMHEGTKIGSPLCS